MSANFEYQVDEYLKRPELAKVFQHFFANGTADVKSAAITALSALISVLEPKEVRQFDSLVPDMVQAGVGLLSQDTDKYGDDVLSGFCDIAEAEPKFFKKSFEVMTKAFSEFVYNKNVDDQNLKESASEVLILVLERLPSLAKNNKELLGQVLQIIFYNMVQIDEEIDPEWASPKEGFSDAMENGEVDTDEVSFGI